MKSWQQCPSCGGVFCVWRDPNFVPRFGDTLEPSLFVWPDGQEPTPGTPITCLSCGAYCNGLAPEHRREEALV